MVLIYSWIELYTGGQHRSLINRPNLTNRQIHQQNSLNHLILGFSSKPGRGPLVYKKRSLSIFLLDDLGICPNVRGGGGYPGCIIEIAVLKKLLKNGEKEVPQRAHLSEPLGAHIRHHYLILIDLCVNNSDLITCRCIANLLQSISQN